MSTVQQGVESRASNPTISKPTTATTKTFRFYSMCEDPVDKVLENYRILQMERQTDRIEYEV
jgi:hypothetical protein